MIFQVKIKNMQLTCLQYWFLDNPKAKRCIQGRETVTPTFTKWSIQRIFDMKNIKFIPNMAEVIQNKNKKNVYICI